MTIIRITREQGYDITDRVTGYHQFPPGDYRVPDQMPANIARQCVASGCGVELKKPADRETKAKPRKKKRRSTAAGKKRSS